jgi:hypothetical protein
MKPLEDMLWGEGHFLNPPPIPAPFLECGSRAGQRRAGRQFLRGPVVGGLYSIFLGHIMASCCSRDCLPLLFVSDNR